MSTIKLISYYSDLPGLDYYKNCSEEFLQNCLYFNIDAHVQNLESAGSYRLNCLRKPQFILDCLIKFNTAVMWLDIDSKIHTNLPVLNNNLNFDIGLCYLGFGKELLTNLPPKASPIIFNNTELGIYILKQWIHECENNIKTNGHFFDHEVLVDFILPKLSNIKVLGLDQMYCMPDSANFANIPRHVTMGIAKHEHKKQGLREMGHDEARIQMEIG